MVRHQPPVPIVAPPPPGGPFFFHQPGALPYGLPVQSPSHYQGVGGGAGGGVPQPPKGDRPRGSWNSGRSPTNMAYIQARPSFMARPPKGSPPFGVPPPMQGVSPPWMGNEMAPPFGPPAFAAFDASSAQQLWQYPLRYDRYPSADVYGRTQYVVTD